MTGPSAPTSVNAGTIAITGSAEAGTLVQVYNDSNGDGVIDDGEQVVASQQLGANQAAFDITTPLTANAANHFLVVAVDAAGNASGAVMVPVVTEDSLPPAAPTVVTPTGAVTVNTSTETIAGTAEAGSLVQIYDGDEVIGSEQLSPGQTSYSVAVPLDSNSPNNFLITATDAAGNQSPAAVVPTITQDSIPPSNPILTSPAVPISVNSGSITLTGTQPKPEAWSRLTATTTATA